MPPEEASGHLVPSPPAAEVHCTEDLPGQEEAILRSAAEVDQDAFVALALAAGHLELSQVRP
jgi:hypothetical protein